MIPVSWPDVVTGACAAATLEGRSLSVAELAAMRSMAQGVASVLSSSIDSPGQVPTSFTTLVVGDLSADRTEVDWVNAFLFGGW